MTNRYFRVAIRKGEITMRSKRFTLPKPPSDMGAVALIGAIRAVEREVDFEVKRVAFTSAEYFFLEQSGDLTQLATAFSNYEFVGREKGIAGTEYRLEG